MSGFTDPFAWLQNTNSRFAASRMPADAAGQTAIIKVVPTDLGVDVNRLKSVPDSAKPAPLSVNPMNYGQQALQGLNIGLTDKLVLVSPSTKRVYLLIQNTHPTQNLYVNFGAEASVNAGIRIIPGGNYELTQFIPQDDIHIIADGINTTGVLSFSNKGAGEGL